MFFNLQYTDSLTRIITAFHQVFICLSPASWSQQNVVGISQVIYFLCHHEDSNPPPIRYTFYKQGIAQKSGSREWRYVASVVDTMNISCVAHNAHGSGEMSEPIELQIQGRTLGLLWFFALCYGRRFGFLLFIMV